MSSATQGLAAWLSSWRAPSFVCPLDDARSCDKHVVLGGGCIPLRFILGAQKAGTSTVFEATALHGCGPSFGLIPHKESHLLGVDCIHDQNLSQNGTVRWHEATARLRRGECTARTLNAASPAPTVRAARREYMAAFQQRTCISRCFIDATPAYLRDPRQALTLRTMLTSTEAQLVRFLVLLREPISRDLSLYHMGGATTDRRTDLHGKVLESYGAYATRHLDAFCTCAGIEACPVQTATGEWRASPRAAHSLANAVAVYYKCMAHVPAYGLYAPQLAAWQEQWPHTSGQILVLSYEQVVANASAVLPRIQAFFGVPTGKVRLVPVNTHVSSSSSRQMEMECTVRARLTAFYAPWNELLLSEVVPWLPPFPAPETSLPCVDWQLTTNATHHPVA